MRSLGTIALVAAVLLCIKQMFELRSMRTRVREQSAEIDKLRGELGVFEVNDPTKAHLLFIRRSEPDSFRYRVYLPRRQREYEICATTKDVNLSHLPDDKCQCESLRAGGVIPIDGTSFFVDVFLAKNADGVYHWHVRHPRGELVEPFVPFAAADKGHITWGNSAGRVELSDPKEPIILVRWIPDMDVGAPPDVGLAVWIR